MLLALLMVAVLLLPEIMTLSPEVVGNLDLLDWFIYACFATDFVIKLYLAPSVGEHLRRNWLDVIILALPLLRLLRIVRGSRLIRLLRAVRVLTFLSVWAKHLRGILAKRGLNIVLLATLGLVLISAGLVAAVERDAGGSIKEFGDALWWAAATVTTVGYGDAFPVTVEGRGVAMFLMLIGIVFFGILTANIAAYFVESNDQGSIDALNEKLDLVLGRLDAMEARSTNNQTVEIGPPELRGIIRSSE
jgi:voltage-gated potassium channel